MFILNSYINIFKRVRSLLRYCCRIVKKYKRKRIESNISFDAHKVWLSQLPHNTMYIQTHTDYTKMIMVRDENICEFVRTAHAIWKKDTQKRNEKIIGIVAMLVICLLWKECRSKWGIYCNNKCNKNVQHNWKWKRRYDSLFRWQSSKNEGNIII